MQTESWIWLAFGGGAGVLHAWLLWKGRAAPLAAFVRMGLVGGCLLAAAIAGGLLPAATGWFVGMVGHGLICLRRGRA